MCSPFAASSDGKALDLSVRSNPRCIRRGRGGEEEREGERRGVRRGRKESEEGVERGLPFSLPFSFPKETCITALCKILTFGNGLALEICRFLGLLLIK